MRNSALARMAVMAFLILTLLIPLSMVESVVSERTSRRNDAVSAVSATWGGPQTVTGPVLTIPYTVTWNDNAGNVQRATRRVHLLPKDLRFDSVLSTELRRRGIFDVVVYRTELKAQGRFARPDLSWVRPTPASIEWSDATLSVGISDPRALTRRAAIDWNGRTEPFTSGVADVGLFGAGIQAPARGLESVQPGVEIPFSFTIALNGTRDIRFLPAAEETTVNLTATWPHPSFIGGPLPQTRTTGPQGFTAQWRAPDFGRPFPARWTCSDVDNQRQHLPGRAEASAFGVSLVQPVDIYQQAERAVKYAVLFLVLTFLVFFLWEVFSAVLLHPVQYAFVGFALCLFYLLLVSISEHAGFDLAYAVSAFATTAVISGYARVVLRGSRQAASVAVSLAGVYGFLYLLLRLEDYALLAGSVGLFVVLSLVMFVTRNMNWYELRLGAQEELR
jgi:inner membrane protein